MKHTSHQLELSEFQSWVETHETVYASDGKGKRLTVTASGTFKVYYDNKCVWQTTQPFSAVEEYNSI